MSDQKWPTLCIPSRRLILGQARREFLSSDEIDEFNIHLLKIDSFTNNIYLSSPSQVMIDANGLTGSGLRYTMPCFRKVCQEITPRLFGLLFDVASGSTDQKSRSKSSLEATATRHVGVSINIFNQVVEEYFHRLDGSILLENLGAGMLDGFATNDSKVFELGPVVQTLMSMFNSCGWNALHIFAEDRFVRLMFGSEERVKSVDGSTFMTGAMVDINPAWKTNCITGCRTLVRLDDGVFARRIVRVPPSRTFESVRTSATLATLLLAQDHNDRFLEQIRNNIDTAAGVSLGLVPRDSGGSVSETSIHSIKSWMTRNNVLMRHASDIIKLVICWGGSQESSVDAAYVTPSDVEGRTWYDLAINMLRHADKIMDNQSDIIRGLAMKILAYRVAAMEG